MTWTSSGTSGRYPRVSATLSGKFLKPLSCSCGSQQIQLAYLTDDAVGDSVPDVVVCFADTIDDPADEGIGAAFRTEHEPAGRVYKDKILFLTQRQLSEAVRVF